MPASELTAALKQLRELQRLQGKMTMEVENLKEAVSTASRAMIVSRAQLSLRVNHSAVWQDRCCHRCNDEADTEILSDILDIISDMTCYGHQRVWGILRERHCAEGLLLVNTKRLHRIMIMYNMLLFLYKIERSTHEHKG